jgi:putative spermidine/putrescine transport system ATP-binding protein
MRNGAIAQIGSPREIYFFPQSRFVAEFVGAANILEAVIENGELKLPGGCIKLANGARTGPVTAMVRPEAIGIVHAENALLCGRVESVSFVGDRQRLIVADAADRPLVVSAANSIDVKVGERVGLAIEPDAVRLLGGDER